MIDVLDFLNETTPIPYVKDFLDAREADQLFAVLQTMTSVRERNRRNQNVYICKLHYGTYAPLRSPGSPILASQTQQSYGKRLVLGDAPNEIKSLKARLTAYAGKDVNYLSILGYENENDHIGWHQHREDRGEEDQSVWVLSLGQVRELTIRPVGCDDKSQYVTLMPEHGSLYVLPHEYNTTHEHAILDSRYRCGLRISINCKHIHVPDPDCPHNAGWRDNVCVQCGVHDGRKYREFDGKPFVREPGPPRIYRITKAKRYPANAVYVGRGGFWCGQEWPATPFGNHKRLNGDAWKAEVARLMASPEFRAQVESLRGKDLLCWCSPREEAHCHARAWLELANGMTTNTVVGTPEPEPPEPPKRKKTQAASSPKIPTFRYPGGKARLAKRIAAILPSGKRFVEPFAGRGNVYFYVAANGMYPSYWLNDIQTAPFLFTMRIGHILAVPKPGKESLHKYREIARDKQRIGIARSCAVLMEPYLCWNGGVYGQSGGTGRGTQAGYSESIRLASEILRGTNTKITRLDYRDVLAQCGEGDVVYLDPPYLDANVKAYSDKTLDHRELVEILKNAKFKWVLSEYRQSVYIETFGEPALRIPVMRGMGKPGGGSKGQKEAVECFWTNFASVALEPVEAAVGNEPSLVQIADSSSLAAPI